MDGLLWYGRAVTDMWRYMYMFVYVYMCMYIYVYFYMSICVCICTNVRMIGLLLYEVSGTWRYPPEKLLGGGLSTPVPPFCLFCTIMTSCIGHVEVYTYNHVCIHVYVYVPMWGRLVCSYMGEPYWARGGIYIYLYMYICVCICTNVRMVGLLLNGQYLHV